MVKSVRTVADWDFDRVGQCFSYRLLSPLSIRGCDRVLDLWLTKFMAVLMVQDHSVSWRCHRDGWEGSLVGGFQVGLGQAREEVELGRDFASELSLERLI